MKRTMIAGLLAILGASALARAATIETPPLHVGGNQARCMLANHSDKEIVVSDARILDQNGNVAVAGAAGAVVPANSAAVLVAASVQQGSCRVSGTFVKNRVRATLCSTAGGGDSGACLEAVTAP
jgi:hypothetical protein